MNNNESSYDFNFEYYREKRKVRGRNFYLWKKSIPFYIERNLNRNLIVEALRGIEAETCIRFHEVKQVHRRMSGIRYSPGNICFSFLGKRLLRGFQKIFIAKYCEKLGPIQHETLHALGIDHEHSRIDRNKYLFVQKENIEPSSLNDFTTPRKIHSNTLGLPYDYGSIMHYDMFAFSKNKEPTLLPKHMLYNHTMGHIHKLSFIDIKTINLLYCRNKCSFKIDCDNGSYQHPTKCFQCICVEGFVGKNCNHFTTNLPSCGKSMHVAQESPREIIVIGKINCYYQLTTEKNSKIMLKVVYTKIYPSHGTFCWPENSLEIKYWEDKTVTGARFCGSTQNIVFLSKSNVVIVYFRSTNALNIFMLMFKKH
uniref:Zinc metalloproteinase n=1 Tax=Strongyloides papillosus TaxID=174720 RepID=A0A0N5BYM3_STREA